MIPDPAVVTGGTSLLPDNFAVNLLKFCCANIVVMRPDVATASNNNVAVAGTQDYYCLDFRYQGRTM